MQDTACRVGIITNTAKLQTVIGTYPATFTSNTTTHKLDCPPVVPPNNDPPYAESEIQVYPYPLVTGNTHAIQCARVQQQRHLANSDGDVPDQSQSTLASAFRSARCPCRAIRASSRSGGWAMPKCPRLDAH